MVRANCSLLLIIMAALSLPVAQHALEMHQDGGAEGGGGSGAKDGRGLPHARVFFPPDMHCFADKEMVYLQVIDHLCRARTRVPAITPTHLAPNPKSPTPSIT